MCIYESNIYVAASNLNLEKKSELWFKITCFCWIIWVLVLIRISVPSLFLLFHSSFLSLLHGLLHLPSFLLVFFRFQQISFERVCVFVQEWGDNEGVILGRLDGIILWEFASCDIFVEFENKIVSYFD